MGRKSKKEGIYVYIWLIHFAVQQKLTQQCKATTLQYKKIYTEQKLAELKYTIRTLLHCWWECKLVQPLWKTVWRFLRKLKIELPYDPAIPLLGVYPDRAILQKDTCTPMFIATLFTIAKIWKQPQCPLTDEWIKMWYIYEMEYYSAIKKE